MVGAKLVPALDGNGQSGAVSSAIEWLNQNSGAIGAVAMVGTVVFTAVAAAAAWRAISSERRLRRSDLRLDVPLPSPDDGDIEFFVWNVGAAQPIHAQWFLTRFLLGSVRQGGGGESLDSLRPGTSTRLTLPRGMAEEGLYIVIARLDADGVSRAVTRWYKLSGEPRRNVRSDLRRRNPYDLRSDRPRRLYAWPSVRDWPSHTRAWFEILALQRAARRGE